MLPAGGSCPWTDGAHVKCCRRCPNAGWLFCEIQPTLLGARYVLRTEHAGKRHDWSYTFSHHELADRELMRIVKVTMMERADRELLVALARSGPILMGMSGGDA